METVRDKLWIFTCVAGSDNDSFEKANWPQRSRMTPAEGAFYLDVPNLMLIRWRDQPAPPFEQYAVPFTPLKQLVWSIVGSGGQVEGDELQHVLNLGEKFPSLTGVMMDDFFKKDGSGALDNETLKTLRPRLQVHGRPLDLWVVLYTHQLNLPVGPALEHCDIVSLWTWNSDDLPDLETNLERTEKLAPGKHISLGMYFWDYHNLRPVTIEQMEHQCNLGLKWLREGRIHSIVLLANTLADVGLDSAVWAREWVKQVGGIPL
ncbi:MAG: hypothetical protein O2954_10940 [bacterium]|nr:hypothetical protein [bacterium]